MFNPLVNSFDELSDNELENKITDLSQKYFRTTNPDLKNQISVMLEMHKQEAIMRRAKAANKLKEQNGNSDLDNLINIS